MDNLSLLVGQKHFTTLGLVSLLGLVMIQFVRIVV